MTAKWSGATRRHFDAYSENDCEAWFRQGLRDWPGRSGHLHAPVPAFFPLQNLFSPIENPEEQLADLFGDLSSEYSQQKFLKGISRSLQSCGCSAEEWSLFDSLEYIIALVRRPEPLPAMVDRLCHPDFLQRASAEIAEHLYAKALLAIGDVSRGADIALLIGRLLESEHFQMQFAPAVLRILIEHDRSKLFDYLDMLSTFFVCYREQAAASENISSVLGRLRPIEARVVVERDSFRSVINNEQIGPWIVALIERTQREGATAASVKPGTSKAQDELIEALPFQYQLFCRKRHSNWLLKNAVVAAPDSGQEGGVSANMAATQAFLNSVAKAVAASDQEGGTARSRLES